VHDVDQLHSLSVASRTARRLEDDVVGEHVGCAPTTEHVIEQHERLATIAPHPATPSLAAAAMPLLG
jgi:hypothetical protein